MDEADVVYKCVGCSKVYSTLHSLDRHKKIECGKEPSQLCHLCSFMTKQPINLKRHLALKHNIIPDNQASCHAYESRICYKCGSTFKTKNSLDDHLRYKCGKEATRLCPFCNHKTVTPSQLSSHIKRIHKITPIKKARSVVNSKISELKSFRVSDGYKCPKCEKVLKCVYGLRRHLTKSCGKELLECCPFCKYKSKNNDKLCCHMFSKHQVNK